MESVGRLLRATAKPPKATEAQVRARILAVNGRWALTVPELRRRAGLDG